MSPPEVPSFRNHILGRDREPRSGLYLDVVDPSRGTVLSRFPRSDARDVDEAVAAARGAFPAWASTPAPARGEVLFRAAELLKQRKDAIARVLSREMGKRLEEARGDVQEALDTAWYAGSEGRRLFGRTAPSELREKVGWTVRRPLGVVGVLTAWNFPVAVPSWKILPALVCGNTVVWKPAEEAPESGALFAQCLWDAGLPPGVLNVVHGYGEECGAALVAHPDVQALTFTGSTAVGRLLAESAGRALKRVSLELGGKNPVIAMPDADPELCVDGVLWGAFGTAGQRCTATSRLILVGDVGDRILPALVARARALRLGDPEDPTVEVGPLVSARQRERVHGYVQTGLREGAELLCGGVLPVTEPGFFYPPTVLDRVARGSTLAMEEVFGPVLAVLRVRDLDEAIAVANEVPYGLSSSIFTRDVNAAFRAVERIEAGITYVNAPTIGAEAHFPFGGVKCTGNGHREGGWAPYEFFTELKTVYVDYSGTLQRAQIDNRGDAER
ncbi:MAG: aldehyde dehydrogenase family protein [Deltaproteobacteria bacterium]|nr:aldehyde dehydrogenase family protein [Deltaproteobacteria bacterium]